MEKERGYTYCSGKRKGVEVQGGTHSVAIPICCPAGSEPRALFHTHPGGTIEPSPRDIRTMKEKNLPICIKAGTRIRCYRPRR
jgi:proteasome lid subunit RPN8/RPN11